MSRETGESRTVNPQVPGSSPGRGARFLKARSDAGLHRFRVLCAVMPSSVCHYPALSGNNPGIQREASAAGNARRNGARVLSDTSTP